MKNFQKSIKIIFSKLNSSLKIHFKTFIFIIRFCCSHLKSFKSRFEKLIWPLSMKNAPKRINFPNLNEKLGQKMLRKNFTLGHMGSKV
jgi:hypothetical protein